MNVNPKKISVWVASAMLVIHGCVFGQKKQTGVNYLEQARHTITEKKGTMPHLELGSVALYFSKSPIMNLLSQGSQGPNQQVELFFPLAEFKQVPPNSFKQDRKDVGLLYEVKLSAVEKPIRGIKCIITYNPRNVSMTYDAIMAANLQYGLMIRFHDKNILNLIKCESAVLRTAQRVSKKRVL